MDTNTWESHELLCLFKCTVDTGTDVLSAFASYKLLPKYDGSFELFLDDTKHEIFHLWYPHRSVCCACPREGCILKRTGNMDNSIFEQMYDDTGSEVKEHIIKHREKIVNVCLHKYRTRNISIQELDIRALSFLLRNLVHLPQNEAKALDTIATYISKICHAYFTSSHSEFELNTAWIDLENALVCLADSDYRWLIRKQIKCLHKVNLEKEEKTQLLTKMKEVINVSKYIIKQFFFKIRNNGLKNILIL